MKNRCLFSITEVINRGCEIGLAEGGCHLGTETMDDLGIEMVVTQCVCHTDHCNTHDASVIQPSRYSER